MTRCHYAPRSRNRKPEKSSLLNQLTSRLTAIMRRALAIVQHGWRRLTAHARFTPGTLQRALVRERAPRVRADGLARRAAARVGARTNAARAPRAHRALHGRARHCSLHTRQPIQQPSKTVGFRQALLYCQLPILYGNLTVKSRVDKAPITGLQINISLLSSSQLAKPTGKIKLIISNLI